MQYVSAVSASCRISKKKNKKIEESDKKLKSTVNFVCLNYGDQLEALADLVCSLMLCAHNDKANTTIKIPKPIGNNIHFWNINDINDINDITNN